MKSFKQIKLESRLITCQTSIDSIIAKLNARDGIYYYDLINSLIILRHRERKLIGRICKLMP